METGTPRGAARGPGWAGRLAAAACVLAACSGLLLFPPLGRQAARGQLGSLAGWSFMVDPGHGGTETGAVGPTGLRECDVNLAVSLKLRSLLEAEGATVHMTRTDDRNVSIGKRWQRANELGVDRFISVHHNAVSQSGVNYALALISVGASAESEDLATKAVKEISWELGLPAHERPVWRVDYRGVLNNTNMPAILTEASFISNPAEEQRLRDPYYNQREAEAIFRAVLHHCGGPHLYFIEPKEGTLIHKDAAVKVSVPEPAAVARVDFYLDGAYAGTETVPPFTRTLNTGALDDGVYELRAEAVYGGGQAISVTTNIAVSNAARDWYFAEGTTREGFEEWLTLFNPNELDVSAAVTYCFMDEAPMVRTYSLPSTSRMTVNVRSEAGDGRDVSLQVSASGPVVAERPMYFDYNHKWQGGHVVLGANRPARRWHFAEGYTGTGFEEWLCVYNPNDAPADVEVEYQGENGEGNLSASFRVEARSRYSQYVNEVVGPGRNISLLLDSNRPVVAERPVYFDYSGKWRGGSAAMGVNAASTLWFFAEGCTRSGFEEWLCVQNPNDHPTTALITYITADAPPFDRMLELPERSRRTVFVNQEAGPGRDVSIMVRCDDPVVAERPIYYDYHGWAAGGDVGSGVTGASCAWYFAEGYTGEGFEEWLSLLNPQPAEVGVVVLYFMPDGEVARERYSIPASSRSTFNVNQIIYTQGDVSLYVLADRPIVAERPVYFKYSRKWSGGSDGAGFAPGLR